MGFLSARAKQETESSGVTFFNVNKIQLNKAARIRILSPQPLEGYQIWGNGPSGRKAFRFESAPSPIEIDTAFGDQYTHGVNNYTGEPEGASFFIAVAIWDYETEAVRVMQVTQKTLMRSIEEIASKPDYDPIQDWDLDIKHEEKSYSVLPLPVAKATRKLVEDTWAEALKDGFDLASILPMQPRITHVKDTTGLAGGRLF